MERMNARTHGKVFGLVAGLIAGVTLSCPAWPQRDASAAPVVLRVTRIWDAGGHNAFTDLIRWKNAWWCVFREADGHVKGDGKIRLITSPDGEAWQSAVLIAETGIDLRDPKLSLTPDSRLMIVAGGSVYRDGELVGRQPRVSFSENGRDWSDPQRVLNEGDWLWRVTWHDGIAYGGAYRSGAGEWSLRLVRSTDVVNWEDVTTWNLDGRPNETTLRFLDDGRMVALVRREGADKQGVIGVSPPPYTDWSWTRCGHRLGGPEFIVLPNGVMWAASRNYEPFQGHDPPMTVLARMTRDSYEPVLVLPSGGDTSYPGLVWHDGLLWMSYYSSHEGKTSIYLARIRLPEE